MALQLREQADGRLLDVEVNGKLEKEDYQRFVPEVERLIVKNGKVRVRLTLTDFHGWTAGAVWEDIKFDVKHFNDIERVAIVGGSKWEKGMATFCKPFTTAKVKFFPHERADEAGAWVVADL